MPIPRPPHTAVLFLAICLAACDRPAPPATPSATSTPAPRTAATDGADSDVGALVVSANDAFRRGRYAAPAGANALELFLAVRDRDAANTGAREALVDLYPLALATAEAALAAGDRSETRRVLDLLDRAAPASLGARDLRARLDAAPEPATSPPPTPVAVEAAATRVVAAPLAAPASAAVRAPQDAAAAAAPLEPEQPSAAPAAPASATAPALATMAPAAAAPGAVPRTVAVEPPVLTQRVEPAYPDLARRRRVEGYVDLEFEVDPTGRPRRIRVVESSPNAIFDAAAQRALQRWRFEPARRNGVPEAARSRTRIVFRLG